MGFVINIEAIEGEKIENQDAVLIYFGRFNGLDEIHTVDTLLFDLIPEEIGRHDGHEVAVDDTHGTFFTYGKNAETLYKTMEPILDRFEFLDDAEVEMRFFGSEGNFSSLEIMRSKAS